MTRSCFAVLCVAGLATWAGAAFAQIPSPARSTTPACLLLVGRDFVNYQPDPSGTFCVTVRDAAGIPLAGTLVEVVFQGCGDVSLCAADADPTVTVDCPARTLRKFSGPGGTACFTIVGGTRRVPASGPGCALIRADGVALGQVSVAALDLDSAGNLGPADASYWLDDYFSSLPPRVNCDCFGEVTPADFSFWQGRFFDSWLENCGDNRCP